MAFKVVLVDDDLLVLQDLETLADWGKYGFTIAQTFTNGVAALRGIREIRPDFIVRGGLGGGFGGGSVGF